MASKWAPLLRTGGGVMPQRRVSFRQAREEKQLWPAPVPRAGP